MGVIVDERTNDNLEDKILGNGMKRRSLILSVAEVRGREK
jgi:hypothetical protein